MDDVVIAVSELAANAVRHARTGYSVVVEQVDDGVVVTVTDSGEGEVSTTPPSKQHGRGLAMVEELAADWGVYLERERSEKTVWALFEPRRLR